MMKKYQLMCLLLIIVCSVCGCGSKKEKSSSKVDMKLNLSLACSDPSKIFDARYRDLRDESSLSDVNMVS